MICVGLLIAIRITGTAALRGCMDLDAELASGTAGLELVAPGDFDSVSAPGVAVLGIGIAGGLQGLRTAAIDPQKLSYNACQHAGMRSNQTQFPAASHCGICIVVIKAACKTKKKAI